MSVSVFPAPSTGGGGGGGAAEFGVEISIAQVNSWVNVTATLPSGDYHVRFMPELNSAGSAIVTFLDASGYGLGTANAAAKSEFQAPAVAHIRAGAEVAYVRVYANVSGYVNLTQATPLSTPATLPSKTVTTVATSGSVTFTEETSFALFGGGGGGGNTVNGTSSYKPRSRGGGSGYVTFGTLPAGTYTLSLGAGGGGNTNGGTSTFSTFSAAGGITGNSTANGGSGGAGAASWYHDGAPTYAYGTAGVSGANGSSGSSGYNDLTNYTFSGGVGSGVALPSWLPESVPTYSGNTGGGFYAGGGGGEGNSAPGSNATGYAGGGGGTSSGDANLRVGGTGGNGVLMYWSAI